MKKITLLIASIITLSGMAQNESTWNAFRDSTSELIGFKDKHGKVMIDPRLMGYTIAQKFENVIAAMEEKNGKYITYYLSKSGRIFGEDSVYIFDNSPDCESEGYVRFKDPNTHLVGLFDAEGNIVIPAKYNDLSKVHNGMLWALKGAHKHIPKRHKKSGCDHSYFEGGSSYLINTHNQVLAENFSMNEYLNFYSMRIQDQAPKDTTLESFIGVNNKYYVFLNYTKDFHAWLSKTITNNYSDQNLMDASLDSLVYFDKVLEKWLTVPTKDFVQSNTQLFRSHLDLTNRDYDDYFITINGLNHYIFGNEKFDKYYDNCSDPKIMRYPTLNLIINQKINDKTYQDQFEFLKTEEGYKMISFHIAEMDSERK